MGKTRGRPKSENPKALMIKFRADKQTVQALDYCCEKMSKTRSDILRLGIQKVKAEAENAPDYAAQQEGKRNA